MKPILISFELCPFVQRSVITLLEKRVDFDIRYIDLSNPPQWFLDISPFGKVPVLRVGKDTIFESAVISEYLDDMYPPSMHPSDPLVKAINRAWIEYGSEMIVAQYHYYTAKSEDNFNEVLRDLKRKLRRLNEKFGTGPYFNGENFSLIDAAYAPFFTRINLLESVVNNNLYEDVPKVAQWADRLIVRESVKKSVVPDFEQKYLMHVARAEGFAGKLFRQAKRVKTSKEVQLH